MTAESDELYSTGEVMKRTGLSRQVLYQYTTLGLIKESQTTPGGHRRYGPEVLKRLWLIKELKETGYTLRDIKDIFSPRLCRAEESSA